MNTPLRAVLSFAAALVLGRTAVAGPTPEPAAARLRAALEANGPEARSKAAEAVDGIVVGVDYARGLVDVQTAPHRVATVVVVPSTAIEGRTPGFHAMSDIVKGARVHILVSARGSTLVAQMIELR